MSYKTRRKRAREEKYRKEHMRYISTDRVKLPKEIPDADTLPKILTALCEAYVPTPKFNLNMKQLRSLNKAMDTIVGEPEDGYYVLDNEEFEVLKALVEQYAPTVLLNARNAPVMMDALMASPEKKPEKVQT